MRKRCSREKRRGMMACLIGVAGGMWTELNEVHDLRSCGVLPESEPDATRERAAAG
jgi:hypothetical protein